ncbi:hypothetical protein TELCIR_24071, partial [Teladorsagia circumcincta]
MFLRERKTIIISVHLLGQKPQKTGHKSDERRMFTLEGRAVTAGYLVILLIGLLGNILAISVLRKHPLMKTHS